MGGNGTFSKGHDIPEESRQWTTVDTIPAGGGFPEIAVVEMKDHSHVKTPPESHTPDRIYAAFNSKGTDVREISINDGHQRSILIHTNEHNGLQPHYHEWKDGKPQGEPHALTPELSKLLQHVRNYIKK